MGLLKGDKLRWVACGGPFQPVPMCILVGSTQVEDGARILGLTIRGQNGLTVATHWSTGSYACVVPGWGK